MNYDLSESSVLDLVHILLSINAQSSPRTLENIGYRAGVTGHGSGRYLFCVAPNYMA